MDEPVTANDLADVLRKILESNSVDVLGTRALLARYDAQQLEPSKPARDEIEQAAVNVLEAWDCPEGKSFFSLVESLREALRKRGAL